MRYGYGVGSGYCFLFLVGSYNSIKKCLTGENNPIKGKYDNVEYSGENS